MLAELAAAAGLRWTIEKYSLPAKNDRGLDHVKRAPGMVGTATMSLAMAAAVFPARIAAEQRRAAFGKHNENESEPPNGSGMIAKPAQTLTILEFCRLIARLLPRPSLTVAFIWGWSRWRRQHRIAAAKAHRKSPLNAQLEYQTVPCPASKQVALTEPPKGLRWRQKRAR